MIGSIFNMILFFLVSTTCAHPVKLFFSSLRLLGKLLVGKVKAVRLSLMVVFFLSLEGAPAENGHLILRGSKAGLDYGFFAGGSRGAYGRGSFHVESTECARTRQVAAARNRVARIAVRSCVVLVAIVTQHPLHTFKVRDLGVVLLEN